MLQSEFERNVSLETEMVLLNDSDVHASRVIRSSFLSAWHSSLWSRGFAKASKSIPTDKTPSNGSCGLVVTILA
jgi:hypothetical protein